MQLKILGSAGSAFSGKYTTCALINDAIALDLGTGLHTLRANQMVNIKDAVITHSHLDHIAMLCFWTDLQLITGNSVTIHCLQETADAIRSGLLNGATWPDMEKINLKGVPALSFNIVEPFKPFTVAGETLTPLPVEHGVPTVGYCLHGKKENFVFCSDMVDAPDAFWKYLSKLENFHRMSMEISFPNEMEEIAKVSYHMTPRMLARHLPKLPETVINVFYNHVKVEHEEAIRIQVHEDMHPRVTALRQGMVLDI